LTSGYIAYGNASGTGLTGSSALTYDDNNGISVSRITFPNSASLRASANTLDDYEEGTWTPSWNSSFLTGVSYSTQEGQYTKIGNFVFIRLRLGWSGLSFNNSGTPWISGVPFNSSLSNTYVGLSVGDMYSFTTSLNGLDNGPWTPYAIVDPYPSALIRVGYWFSSLGTVYGTYFSNDELPASGQITISGSYIASGN
jgi:hypothetical protein